MLQDQMPKHNINDSVYSQTWSRHNKCVIAGIRLSSVECRTEFQEEEAHFLGGEWEYQVYRVLGNNQLQEWGWTSERDILTREEFIEKYDTDPELIYQKPITVPPES
jgi:hypothetical protein